MRTIGVTLILAAAAYVVLDGAGPLRRRAAKAALMCGVCAAVWLAANGAMIASIPYFAEFRNGTASAQSGASHMGIRSRVAANLIAYAGAVPETVYYGYSLRDPAPKLVGAAIILAILLGFAFAAWRKRTLVEYYCLAYGAVLLVYQPANSGNLRRYLVPVIPFLLYYFARGLEALGVLAEQIEGTRLLAARWWRTASIALLAFIGAWNLARTVQASVLHRQPEMFDFYRFGDFRGYQRMAEWTRANTPASSVIGTRGPYIFHIFSRRRVLWLPDVTHGTDDSVIAAAVRQRGMGYVTTDGTAAADSTLFAAFARDDRDFARLYEDGRNVVYRVLPPGEGAAR